MGEYTITLYLRILPRINRTTVMQLPGCRQMHIRFRTNTATVFNTSVSRQGNRPCLRTNMTGVTNPRYFIRTPYNGVLASQTRHDYCPQSSMIRGVMSPGLVGRW